MRRYHFKWLLHHVCLLFVLYTSANALKSLPDAACLSHVKQGDVNLGGIFSFHFSWGSPCGGQLNDFAVQLAEMMIFEIERINARDDILPNVTLGYVIRDDCGSEDIALWSALSYINQDTVYPDVNSRQLSCPHDFSKDDPTDIPVVGLIGTPFSFTSLVVARVGSLYNMPMISYWATTDELSDKSRFPFFLRTVPPDEFQAGAMIDLLIRFNWKYVILLYSVNSYGVHGARQLRMMAEENGICIAQTIAVQPYAPESDLVEIARKFEQTPKAKTVLVFSNSDQVNAVLQTMKTINMRLSLTWIGSDTWGYDLQENGLGYLVTGSLFIRLDQNVVPVFKEHFDELDLDNDEINPWLKQYWIDWRDSRKCTEWKNCPLPIEPYGAALFNAIDAYAYSLHEILFDTCNGSTNCIDWSSIDGQSVLDKLYQGYFQGIDGKFQFDTNGNVAGKYNLVNLQIADSGLAYAPIGYWDPNSEERLHIDVDNIMFADGSRDVPSSLCIEDCQAGFIIIPLEEKCCYGCKKCPSNAIVVNHTECVACPITAWPDKELVQCVTISPDTLRWSDPIISAILISTFIGIALAILTIIGMIAYKDHPLIKATSRELSAVNLSGVSLAIIAVFPLLVRPTTATCPLVEAVISLCFTLVYAPTLLKVNRIYRIFTAGKKSVKRPRYLGFKAQLTLSGMAVGCQVMEFCCFI